MGEALAGGLRRRQPELSISVFDVKAERLGQARSALNLTVADSAAAVARDNDLVIVCVKPQDFSTLASQIKADSRGKRVISILAGRTIAGIAAGLGTDQIARFMPNIAATKGKSVIGVSFHEAASEQFRRECLEVASAFGEPVQIPERLMAAMTGISGSGIAFVLAFVHAMALGGVATGFDYKTAVTLVRRTLEGAVSLLEDGAHPMELASRVTSPAGTTIQGVRALERGGMAGAVMEAVEAAARRAQELEA